VAGGLLLLVGPAQQLQCAGLVRAAAIMAAAVLWEGREGTWAAVTLIHLLPVLLLLWQP
jgi:hypothetical protein